MTAALAPLDRDASLAALSPETGAELDLTAFDSGYQYGTAATGAASPLWGLQVVEVPSIVDALLIDGTAPGVLALGTAAIDIDSSGEGFTKNTSTVRAESSVLMIVRNGQTVYEIWHRLLRPLLPWFVI